MSNVIPLKSKKQRQAEERLRQAVEDQINQVVGLRNGRVYLKATGRPIGEPPKRKPSKRKPRTRQTDLPF